MCGRQRVTDISCDISERKGENYLEPKWNDEMILANPRSGQSHIKYKKFLSDFAVEVL